MKQPKTTVVLRRIQEAGRDRTALDVSLVCPWCGVVSASEGRMAHTTNSTAYATAICQLRECQRLCLLVIADDHGRKLEEKQKYAPKVYPPAKASYGPEGVPENIARDFQETLDCYFAGHDYAAALVGRRVLQSAARNVLGKELPTLQKEIDAIPDAVLSASLKQAAHEVRFVGNDAAHADEVEFQDVAHLIDFVSEVLDALYVTPFKVNELRAKRTAAKAAKVASKASPSGTGSGTP